MLILVYNKGLLVRHFIYKVSFILCYLCIAPSPVAATGVQAGPKDSSLCIIPGCQKLKYKDSSTGATHDYCSKSHAEEGKKRHIYGISYCGIMSCNDRVLFPLYCNHCTCDKRIPQSTVMSQTVVYVANFPGKIPFHM